MPKFLFVLSISMLSISTLFAQNKYTISGYVEDTESGEKLIGVNIFDSKSNQGTITNTYGFFSLTLEKDSIELSVSYVGYGAKAMRFLLEKDVSVNFQLSSDLNLEAVEVVGEKLERIEERTLMSTIGVPIEQIKSLPAFLGETDVLKALQLLPGVQSGGEGQNGIYVRGGSPDQNLILLDGVPVYNASHLFGFFSVFNADAIKDVTLTKGGFPARYGGRLSSVIEINMKEGDKDDWHGTGSIGLIASKFTIEGPLVKEKTSILLSARRTYIDLLARPLIKQGFKSDNIDGVAGYFFDDINAKINHKFSEKDRLFLSVYTGRDKFYTTQEETYNESDRYKVDFNLNWGNITSALRWNHLWNNKLFSNATMTFSRYKFGTLAANEDSYDNYDSVFSLDYDAFINDISGKIDFDWVPNPKHYVKFGANFIGHDFNPGRFILFLEEKEDDELTDKIDTTIGQDKIQAQEIALYVEDDIRISDRLSANLGIHLSGFKVRDEFYTSLQPRVGLRYLAPGGIAIKAAFSNMRQYIQLLTNEGVGLPTDLWLPSTDRIKPQDAWQVGLGIAKTYKDKYEISLEGYYKKMTNLTSYKEGASFFQLNDWEDRITQGEGESYGLEFLVQKKKGRLSGWIGYTLSWSFREFEELNFGKRYPFKYDRRHDISVVGIYKHSDRISISGTWVYGTGNAVTLPNSNFRGYQRVPGLDKVDGQLILDNGFNYPNGLEYFSDRNNFRMRAYHRLDLGISFTKQKRWYKRTWSFGAYNAYNRKNPFFIEVGRNRQNENVLKQISIFPIVPYFNWKFEF